MGLGLSISSLRARRFAPALAVSLYHMELRIQGDKHEIVEGDEVLASARLYRPYDELLRSHGITPNPPMPMVLSDLEGSGNPQAMAMLTRHFVKLSKDCPIHCSVMHANPKRADLLKAYKRLGCRETMTMLVLGGDGSETV